MRIASAYRFTVLVCALASLTCGANATTAPAEHASLPAPQIQAVTASAADMVVANPEAKATVTAIIDYQAYALHLIRDQLSAFTRENPDIKVVIKPWAAGGPLSRFAAKAAYAAARQGKLPEYHAAMISDLGPHTWYSLRNTAPVLGLDWRRFETDFGDEALDRRVDADAASIAALKVTTSPAFIAGGQVFSDPWNKINFAQIAESARRTGSSGAVATREK